MATFTAGFDGRNVVQLARKNDTSIFVAYNGTFEANGRTYEQIHIREMYSSKGQWCPGKGVAIKVEDFPAFLEGLTLWAKTHGTGAAPKVPEPLGLRSLL